MSSGDDVSSSGGVVGDLPIACCPAKSRRLKPPISDGSVGVIRESLAMFYILFHSAEMKGRIPKLNVVSKTLEGLLALYNVADDL